MINSWRNQKGVHSIIGVPAILHMGEHVHLIAALIIHSFLIIGQFNIK
jgi:hypothetical protein